MKPKLSIGGQAVMEGVMMRSPNYYATTVRRESGSLVTDIKKIKEKPGWMKKPFIRGIVNLIEMLVIGIKTLTWSANQASEKADEKISNREIAVTLILAFLFTILIFVALPYFLSSVSGFEEETSPVIFNLVDGVIKIALFLVYLWGISYMKDVKRLFQYHGAEHKVVYCHEDNKELTVKNSQKYSTKHPRCGTSFLFIVLIVSIFLFALLPVLFNLIPGFTDLAFLLRKSVLFLSRIVMIPVIAGVSYELLKISGKHHQNFLVKAISAPGIWLQYITTKEPDDSQVEVAIKSMNAVLDKEKSKGK